MVLSINDKHLCWFHFSIKHILAFTVINGEGEQLPWVVTVSKELMLEKLHRKNSKGFNDILNSKKYIQVCLSVDQEGDFTFELKYDQFKKNVKASAKRQRENDAENENETKRRKECQTERNVFSDVASNDINSSIETVVRTFNILTEVSPIDDLAALGVENSNGLEEKKAEKTTEKIENDSLKLYTGVAVNKTPEEGCTDDSKNNDGLDIDGLSIVKQHEVDNYVPNEKRMMMIPITKKDIEDVNLNFFKNNLITQQIKVSRMNHAKRFWLAVKFGGKENLRKLKMKREAVCKIFGISVSTVKKYLPKNGETSPAYETYNNLSPVEFRYKRHQYFFEKYALNYDDLRKQGLFKK